MNTNINYSVVLQLLVFNFLLKFQLLLPLFASVLSAIVYQILVENAKTEEVG